MLLKINMKMSKLTEIEISSVESSFARIMILEYANSIFKDTHANYNNSLIF